jgi:MFS family permease
MSSPAVVIVAAFLLGACNAFIVPSLQSLLPSLVGREELPSAVALHSSTVNIGRALGPALGALVIATWGIAQAFAVNALSFLVLITAMMVLRPIRRPAPRLGPVLLRDSIAEIRMDPHLWVPIVIVAMASLVTDPVATLTPVLAERIYGFADTYAGLLIGAFGTGAVAAAFIVTGRLRRSLRTVGFTLMGTSLAIGSVALIDNGGVALLPFFIAGALYLTTVTTATSMLHLAVADEHRGRVMAVWTMAFHGIRPFAALVDGSLATALNSRAAVALMVIGPLVVAGKVARDAGRKKATAS